MSSRLFWIKASELDMPSKTVTLYPQVNPPNEPGDWTRVEVTEDPSFRRISVKAELAA